MKFKILLTKRDRGEYQATVPSLPACISSGFSEAETLQRIQSKILLHLGVEEVSQDKSWRDVTYYQYRLNQAITANMSQERKFAAVTTLSGLCLMMAAIWVGGI